MKMKYKCPCCGYYTFNEKPNGNYDICPVCFWEDDPIASDDVNVKCSCNGVSLVQAQQNFLEYGACVNDMIPHTRKPKANELKGDFK